MKTSATAGPTMIYGGCLPPMPGMSCIRTVRAMVRRYRGRVAAWIVCNEVTDQEGDHGLRTDVPWYNTIGRHYVGTSAARVGATEGTATTTLVTGATTIVPRSGQGPQDIPGWRPVARSLVQQPTCVDLESRVTGHARPKE